MARGEVRFEDLPKNVRDRIEASRREKLVRETPTRPGQKLWQCCACGTVSGSWAAAEKHCDEQGHPRVELVLRVDADPQ